MAAMLAVVAIAWETPVPGWEWRLAVSFPIVSGGIAVSLGRFADQTPPDRRVDFWSYRKPNWMLALILAAMVWALASVML